jgi:hypothetical protein
VQLFLIGVLGAVLKLLGDLYADRREPDADAERVRAERDAEAERFRSDVRRRLVAATNTLRKARILIEANRSVLTWSTQMMEIVGARFDLSALRHELEVSVGARAAPFPDPELVILPIQEMERYLEWLTDDLEHKKDLSELQREAEKKDLTADARAELQRAVWDGLLGAPYRYRPTRDPTLTSARSAAAIVPGVRRRLSAGTRRLDARVARPPAASESDRCAQPRRHSPRCRAMTIRCTSFVPSPISRIFWSR